MVDSPCQERGKRRDARVQMITGEEPTDALAAAAGFIGLSTDTGVSIQNLHGEIIAISAQAQRILGPSVDQMLGQSAHDPRWATVDEFGEPVRVRSTRPRVHCKPGWRSATWYWACIAPEVTLPGTTSGSASAPCPSPAAAPRHPGRSWSH